MATSRELQIGMREFVKGKNDEKVFEESNELINRKYD